MRRVVLACGLGVSLAASGCGGGGGGGSAKLTRSAEQNGNRPPRIQGNAPPDAYANESYDFRPAASDPDGDRLVFSIAGKPVWGKFDPQTGRLHGEPRAQDVGVYTGITITVSDGRSQDSLGAFDIVVSESGDGTVTLSWLPPTQNADGSALEDLAGYRIYLGRQPGRLSRVIVLGNPGLTRYVVQDLSPHTWYFAMTSFSRQGQESERSATVRTRVG